MDKHVATIKDVLLINRDRQSLLGFNGEHEREALQSLKALEAALISSRDALAEKEKEIAELRKVLSKVLFQFDGAINYMEDEMEDDVIKDLRDLQKHARQTLDGVPK